MGKRETFNKISFPRIFYITYISNTQKTEKMKKILAIFILFQAFALLANDLYFDGSCDKDPLSYKTNEVMTFTISLKNKKSKEIVTGRKIKWQRKGDDSRIENGVATTDQPLVIKTSSSKPGFVRITVELLDENGKPIKKRNSKFDGGACADVKLLDMTSKPEDFDKFWDEEYKKLRSTPYKTQLTEVKSKDPKIKVSKFSISTLPGHIDATGYILIPVGAKAKSLPIVGKFTGYGFGATPIDYNLAQKGNIIVQVTRQGEEPDRDKEYYNDLKNNKCKKFCYRNNDDMHKNDFYNMIIRGLRALSYAETLPEWDGKTMLVRGGSMGGFQALAMAALNEKVSHCTALVPWMADLEGYVKYKRLKGWRPDWIAQLGYFDVVNFATRIKCPATIEVGLGDYVCPPSGGMLLYRSLKGEKKLVLRQNCGHSTTPYGINQKTYNYSGDLK